MARRRRYDLVDLIRANLGRDPKDAPEVWVEADMAAQDMAWMPEAAEPASLIRGVTPLAG